MYEKCALTFKSLICLKTQKQTPLFNLALSSLGQTEACENAKCTRQYAQNDQCLCSRGSVCSFLFYQFSSFRARAHGSLGSRVSGRVRGTADSRRHDPRFQKQEVGSWKLEVGFSQLCSLVQKKTRESWYGKGSWYKVDFLFLKTVLNKCVHTRPRGLTITFYYSGFEKPLGMTLRF